jgi:hypothetical protein
MKGIKTMARQGIVERKDVTDTLAAMMEESGADSLRHLQEMEPLLGEFLEGAVTQMAGALLLGGMPAPLIQQTADRTITLAVVILAAMRRAQHRHWVDTLPGTPLGKLLMKHDQPKREKGQKDEEN